MLLQTLENRPRGSNNAGRNKTSPLHKLEKLRQAATNVGAGDEPRCADCTTTLRSAPTAHRIIARKHFIRQTNPRRQLAAPPERAIARVCSSMILAASCWMRAMAAAACLFHWIS